MTSTSSEPERVLSHAGQQWVPRTDYTRLKAERDRYRDVLRQIAKDADECPMEDMLSAGVLAREALR